MAVSRILWAIGMAGLILPWGSAAGDEFAAARERLVREQIEPAGVRDSRVLEAIRTTPRHEFIPRRFWDRAYYDMALPIGDAQTISSPFTVASMTEAIDPQPTDKVLEIGTGSGYQAAVLSPLVAEVYTIEIVEALGRQAERDLERLGYANVHVRIGDGFQGWPEAAPFDAIIVTCSPEAVPQPLVDQLREGGQMVIPVGERYQQTLYLLTKQNGEMVRTALRPTLFVPMTGSAEAARTKLPDPANPEIVNGDFESRGGSSDAIPGWYYGRQFTLVAESERAAGERAAAGKANAREANQFVRFENETPGRNAHLLQGLALDGRAVSRVRLEARVRTHEVAAGDTTDQLPTLAISLYDAQRRELGMYWIGTFRGTRDWRTQDRVFRIPPQTREAIVRIGLFGATGKADFDDVRLTPLR
ncbi:protein-L-isoaspartate(D-aspartate) O-methyltransferase [Candidatus Laterigemmans baculatus]|uniref:protein-L-isoaspartate(D-aspartate) O-methyltransferase n=1 Tax=Candidatus Laterigemmans baculatus TaxID=2770505 RepID=UPI0013DCB1E1|nr:protein-L-isoaspartate(D-aspartate) O-methyltransferase [Candidatus Laterigemmans baculatus]